MPEPLRIAAVVFVTLVLFLFLSSFPGWYLLPEHPVTGVVRLVVVLGLTGAGARWLWRNRYGLTSPATLGGSVLLGAVGLGMIAFAAGFFGPMILDPSANQGPLLGIFITGPLGFLVGGIGGAIRWWMRRDRAGAGGRR
jgi:hypothetical protein